MKYNKQSSDSNVCGGGRGQRKWMNEMMMEIQYDQRSRVRVGWKWKNQLVKQFSCCNHGYRCTMCHPERVTPRLHCEWASEPLELSLFLSSSHYNTYSQWQGEVLKNTAVLLQISDIPHISVFHKISCKYHKWPW